MVCIADIDKEVYIMADWLIRALKTFVQAFFGVLIPELCVILNGGFPESIETTWVIFGHIVAAALSAGISAAWNIISAKLKEP